jgi:hypothetical protein
MQEKASLKRRIAINDDRDAKAATERETMHMTTSLRNYDAPTKEGMHYYKGIGRPRVVPAGFELYHNHIRHTADMPNGENGFRFWLVERAQQLGFQQLGFRRCQCGWAGLPHYSRVPSQRCLPGKWA